MTKAALLQAALKLVATEGVDRVTQRRVAALAGTSLATTTYHFKTADDLIVGAFESYAEQAMCQLRELFGLVASGDLALIQAASQMAQRASTRPGEPPPCFAQLTAAAAYNPRLRRVSDDFMNVLSELLAPLVDLPGTEGLLARCLSGLMLHELSLGVPDPSPRMRDDLRQLFDVFGVSRSVDRLVNDNKDPENGPGKRE